MFSRTMFIVVFQFRVGRIQYKDAADYKTGKMPSICRIGFVSFVMSLQIECVNAFWI